jgi:hypothetical protein
MAKGKNALHSLSVSLIAMGVLTALGFGIYSAMHSSLFLLNQVNVQPMTANYPLTSEKVVALARAPVGHANLMNMDLQPIEARLLKSPWIKGVVLSKQFPSTLSIQIIERSPIALLNEVKGNIAYVEKDGTLFEDAAMIYPKDLPILTGFSENDPAALLKVNDFIVNWFGTLKLSSISFDEKLGLRAVISYPMKNQQLMRTILELGLNIEEAASIPQAHFLRVLNYLADRSMTASKIWLGDGKKIVVKISRAP